MSYTAGAASGERASARTRTRTHVHVHVRVRVLLVAVPSTVAVSKALATVAVRDHARQSYYCDLRGRWRVSVQVRPHGTRQS